MLTRLEVLDRLRVSGRERAARPKRLTVSDWDRLMERVGNTPFRVPDTITPPKRCMLYGAPFPIEVIG